MTNSDFKCRIFDTFGLLAKMGRNKKLGHTKILRDAAESSSTNLSPKVHLGIRGGIEPVARLHALSVVLKLRGGRYRPRRLSSRFTRLPPECVCENPYGTTCSPHIFNLTTRNPIVDCSTTDTHFFAGLHDRKSFSVNNHHNSSSLNSRIDLMTDRPRIPNLPAFSFRCGSVLRRFPKYRSLTGFQ